MEYIFILVVLSYAAARMLLEKFKKRKLILDYLKTHEPSPRDLPICSVCSHFIFKENPFCAWCTKHGIEVGVNDTCDLNTWSIFK